MSWLVQPRLVNGPFDDPGLYIDFRYGRRALLFDLGDLSPLSSRELLRVTHAFVSHAHVDHFIGFDRLLRLCLHRPGPLHLVGPPEFIDRTGHKLRGYTWNLIDETSVDFRLIVSEFDGRSIARTAEFAARNGFCRTELPLPSLPEGIVLAESDFQVEAVALDHGTPCLAFALRETMRVNVRRGVIEDLRLPKGAWLTQAKAIIRSGAPDGALDIPGIGRVAIDALPEGLFLSGPGQSIAYVTDAAPSADNASRIAALAADVDQLFIEAVFLERDRALAEATLHLTAREAGHLARIARAKRLIVFHHSARYMGEADALAREACQAFGEAESF